MPESNLIAMVSLGMLEKSLPAVPRAKETGRFAFVGRTVERSLYQSQPDPKFIRNLLQIIYVAVVWDIAHQHMCGLHLETRLVNAGALGKQMQQGKRVFSSGKSDENTIPVVYETEVGTRLVETLPDAPEQSVVFGIHSFKRLQR